MTQLLKIASETMHKNVKHLPNVSEYILEKKREQREGLDQCLMPPLDLSRIKSLIALTFSLSENLFVFAPKLTLSSGFLN